MNIILKQDVKNLGKVGDMVRVKKGYARNFLLPRNLAEEATVKRVKEMTHLKKMAEIKKKKMLEKRKELLRQLSELTVTIKATSGETEKLFGAVTNFDIATVLVGMGHSVDRRDILLENPIKKLGQYKAKVHLGEGLETEIKISIEPKS